MGRERFVSQKPPEAHLLTYSAGHVSGEEGRFVVSNEQKGAMDTFSIGQPVYDKDNNLMGHMEIGVWKGLDWSTDGKFHGEKIPSDYWGIGNPTKHCEIGKQVFTYWQRWNEATRNRDEIEGGEIGIDTRSARALGLTSDRFAPESYLWRSGNTISISLIMAKEKGAFRRLIETILLYGFDFEIPTPSPRMREIGEKQGWHLVRKKVDKFGVIEILANKQEEN